METPNRMQDYIQVNWQSLFQEYCLPAKYVQCGDRFYQFLKADGVFIHNRYLRGGSGGSNQESLLFPETETAILAALKDFKSVFVKLNWKSGKDCKSWVSGLQCSHIQDVLNVLKCSNYIGQILQDYDHLYPQHLFLILREYKEVSVSMEFRCFVHQGVVSVCQRYCQNVFVDPKNKSSYFKRIVQFVQEQVITKLNLDKFVIDLYLSQDQIKIVDIGPWREFTNPLLFDWEGLEADTEGSIRVVASPQDIMYEDTLNYTKPNNEQILQLMKHMNLQS